MASSNKTDKLKLNKWNLNDKPEMADFNNDNDKIEDFKDEFDTHLADNAFHGILLYNENNQSIPSGELTTILWHRSAYKTMDAFFSTANRSRITIPAGVKKVRLSANTYWAVSNTGARSVTINKNGSNVFGMPYARQAALDSTRAEQNIVSATIEVNAGDYFELKVMQTSGVVLDLTAASLLWFALEVVEYDSQQ